MKWSFNDSNLLLFYSHPLECIQKRMLELLPPSTNTLDTIVSPFRSLITNGSSCGRFTLSKSWSEKIIGTYSSWNFPPEMVLTYPFKAIVRSPLSNLLLSNSSYLPCFSSFSRWIKEMTHKFSPLFEVPACFISYWLQFFHGNGIPGFFGTLIFM